MPRCAKVLIQTSSCSTRLDVERAGLALQLPLTQEVEGRSDQTPMNKQSERSSTQNNYLSILPQFDGLKTALRSEESTFVVLPRGVRTVLIVRVDGMGQRTKDAASRKASPH